MNTPVKPTCDAEIIRSKRYTGTTFNPTWALVATILGSSLSFIDGTVVNVALPSIQRELGASSTDVQWVIEAYSLFLCALILVGGSLGDRLGRKRIYMIGIVVFTLASMACGFAPNILTLIIARAAQGVGGALLVPGSLAIISATFDERRRGAAIGAWSAWTTITTALGPVLGGWLVQTLSWRWVFFINAPIAVVALVITFWRVAESRDTNITGPLDWQGAALATIGLGALVIGLIDASAIGFGSLLVIAALIVGVGALAAFTLVEMRSPAPMMPLGLFRSRTFTGANLLTLLLYGALGGALYFLPFNLQQTQGYSPAQAGAALLPFTITIFLLSRWSGGLIQRIGAKIPLVSGTILAAIGFALFAAPGIGGSYWVTFFPAVLMLSLGMALVIAPLTTSVMNAAPVEQSGAASGINNAVSRSAGLIAIAVMNLIFVAVFNPAFDANLAALHLSPELQRALDAQRALLGGAHAPAGTGPAAAAAIRRAIDLAFLNAFRVVTLVGAALALASSVMAALLIEGPGFRTLARRLRSPYPARRSR
ncbi:MAG TPA: MFS transporter [Ktedonobacterales bacterium]|nr:MFS transporter [Ktedonobacterales bacterium]